ncbi:MAG TPA: hypothetical protein VNN80_35140 [Polyangiaceae bacterium]|nr:hypothetical protein [Polyangiaceae bacterium]
MDRPMQPSYDDAVGALHRAPHEAWVAERKRLAAELKAAGDKAGAARLAKLGRPPLSAWAVNQLWWRAPEAFGELFAAAARMRAGDAAAAPARRQALAGLKARAAALLVEAGHGASEGTLRRVTTTLAALAAVGGFEPDLPGALAGDREPPGFDTPGLAEALGRSVAEPAGQRLEPSGPAAPPAPSVPDALAGEAGRDAERRAAEARDAAARQAERDAERRAAEAREAERERERQARRAERQRLDASLVALRDDLERRQREVERLRGELTRVERLAQDAQATIVQAEAELAALGPPD